MVRDVLTALAETAGVCLVGWGLWLAWAPLGAIWAGLVLLAVGWGASR